MYTNVGTSWTPVPTLYNFKIKTEEWEEKEYKVEKYEKAKKVLGWSGKFDKKIATVILLVVSFYETEDEHQDYYKKSSSRYKKYEKWSGRKNYKESIWKKGKEDLKKERYKEFVNTF